MSSPVVERVRTIPLIVEKEMPMEAEEITGYPFDRDSDDRDGYLRSQLDDIAKRHPEIAEHLENFTHRDRQRRRPSTEEAGSPRHFPRQFGNRFERFGFPFDRDDFEPEYYTQFEQPHPQQHSTYEQSQPEHPTNQSTYSQSSPNQSCPQTSNTDRCNLQQSSTFDLGQKQEPVNDRGQRSMSAPPSENTPSNQSQQSENMSQSHSHSETKSSNERIIPIHIEGRDEPVMPKNIPPSYSQQHHAPQPQPERLFGKPTEHFTQFLPHERDARFSNNWNQGFATEEPIRQQRFQPQYAAQKKTPDYVPSQPKDIPIPVHREAPVKHPEHSHHPQHQHQNQQQRSASPQVPPEPPKVTPQPKALNPLEQIQVIQKDVSSLMQQVEAFTGKSKDKQYLYLDEMLTRNLIKLDNIDTQGQENIRSARKEAIKCIEKTIGILEAKAAAGSDIPKESTDVPQETSDVPEESSQFPKESSEVSKEMEVDEKTVEDKVPENTTAGELTEEKNVEPMDTEISSSRLPGSVQESMEVSDASAGPVVTSESVEKKEATPDLESESREKVSEEKLVENSTANKEGTTSEVEMLEDSNSVPESKVVTENQEGNDVKDQVPEDPSATVDAVKVDETTENESGEKKEKKDKKKGKKKPEKKEK